MSGSFKAISLFCDISGFTPLTQSLLKHGKKGNEALSGILRKTFDPMVETIYGHGGFIAKFAGDAFNALFPFDKDLEESIDVISHALSASSRIIAFFNSNNHFKTEFGSFETGIKIGISEGNVEWGILGNKGTNGYYFRGSAIDGSVKQQEKCHSGEISISASIKKYTCYDRVPEFQLKSELTDIPEDVFRSFFPDSFLSYSEGEFRQVVTIFLSFEGIQDYELLNKFFNITLSSAMKYDGYLSSLNFGDKGAFFLLFFGFPQSHEDDVKRSLSFAEYLKKRLLEEDISVFLKMGISYGLVYAGEVGGTRRSDLTCIGDVVNIASRISALGQPFEILTTEEFAEKARAFARIPLSMINKIKGRSDKLLIHRFINLRPFTLIKIYTTSFMGRNQEISNIRNLLDNTIFQGQSGGVIYLNGDLGIGKTRLLHETKKMLEKDGINHSWIKLPCDGIVSREWNGLKQWLKSYFGISESISEKDKQKFLNKIKEIYENKNINKLTRDEILRTHSILSAELGIRIEDSLYDQLDPRMRYENLIICLKELIKAIASVTPAIIEIDDAQWIDDSTAAFLQPLTRNVKDFPYIIIISSRFPGVKEAQKFKLSQDCTITEIELKPLSEEITGQLVLDILAKGNLSADLEQFISENSNGNPFYIEQWLKHLKETGSISALHGEWVLSRNRFDLPSSIDQVIISRIDSLGFQIKDILQHASVIGQRFPFKLLSFMLGSKYPLYEHLSRAENSDLIYQEEFKEIWDEMIFLFSHILIREVAYEMQLSERRANLHKLILELIEKTYENSIEDWYDDLCIHSEMCNDNEKLKEYLEKSGDRYKYKYVNLKAIERYEKLISTDISKTKIIETLLKISQLYKLTGPLTKKREADLKAISIAEEINDRKLLAESMMSFVNTLTLMNDYDEAESTLSKVREFYTSLNDQIGIARSTKSMGSLYLLKNDYNNASEYLNMSLKFYLENQDMENAGLVLSDLSSIEIRKGNFSKSLEIIEQSIGLLSELKNNYGEAIALSNKGILYWCMGEYEKSLEIYQEALVIAKKIGNRNNEVNITQNIASSYCLLFDFTKALELFEKALSIRKETGFVAGEGVILANITQIYLIFGNFIKAMEFNDKCYSFAIEMNDKSVEGVSFMHDAQICSYLGDIEKAREMYEKSLRLFQELNHNRHEIEALYCLADINIKLKNIADARIILEKAYVIFQKLGILSYKLKYLYLSGLISFEEKNFTEASGLLREASEIADKYKEMEYKALSQLKLAEIELIQNNTNEGILLFDESIALIRKIKNKPLLAEALLSYSSSLAGYCHENPVIKEKSIEMLEESRKLNTDMQRKHKIKEIDELMNLISN